MPKAVLVDIRRCIGCRSCQVACKRWNDLEAEITTLNTSPEREWTNPPSLSSKTYTYVRFDGKGAGNSFKWRFAKVQCMHCLEPGCVSICPTRALYKTREGPVLYDEDKCVGCRYCVTGCPFKVPRFDWEKMRMIRKCTMCADRIREGLEPACVAACPTDALTFGERDEVTLTAKAAEAAGAYVYGMEEVGGTSWVYVSDIPLVDMGFPKHTTENPTEFMVNLLGKFAGIGVIGALALYSLRLYAKRRRGIEELKAKSGGE